VNAAGTVNVGTETVEPIKSDEHLAVREMADVCRRIRARFGPSVSDGAIRHAVVAAFARYRSAKVTNFVALLAERAATTQLMHLASTPAEHVDADGLSVRGRVGGSYGHRRDHARTA
jgi:hypothetical protein